MTQQPEALRLANELESYIGRPVCTEAAAELRRLHQSEREGWRYAKEWEARATRLAQRVSTVEAALRQAVETLEKAMGDSAEFGRISYGECLSAITTAKQALGKPDAP